MSNVVYEVNNLFSYPFYTYILQPVQVFRLVTEHTIEEKIVERAQQKLKLDAMVVQSGRLKDKDTKLSRDELLAAVKFGADKIFKSKDSSITDDDIDMIMDAGRKKTQELNDKLQAADKGTIDNFTLLLRLIDLNSHFSLFHFVYTLRQVICSTSNSMAPRFKHLTVSTTQKTLWIELRLKPKC